VTVELVKMTMAVSEVGEIETDFSSTGRRNELGSWFQRRSINWYSWY